MAKYNKGGSPTQNNQPGHGDGRRRIVRPSIRDHRRYSDVLMGKKQLVSEGNQENKVIPVCFTLNLSENSEVMQMLDQALIAENTKVINLAQATTEVSALSKSIKGMYSLSPTKIMIVFQCIEDATNAVSEDSTLWNVFDDVRMWSEGETFDDRLVWLECYGIHPKCWSMENVRKIGEKWGPVLCIDNRVENLCSLSYARMFVRSKAHVTPEFPPVTPLNFQPLNETKIVKDGRKFGCYIKEKEKNLDKC